MNEIEWPMLATLIKPGRVGTAVVEHFEVPKQDADFFNLRMAIGGDRFGAVKPGRYARLHIQGVTAVTPMMSDTQMERRTNHDVVRHANGRVLIGGLGLGMILHPILAKPEVTEVTVLEINPDVIALIEPQIRGWRGAKKLTIVQADALKWVAPKGVRWDTIYFDLWPEISTDNWPEIVRLKQRFVPRLNRKNEQRWFGVWREYDMKPERRRYDDFHQWLRSG